MLVCMELFPVTLFIAIQPNLKLLAPANNELAFTISRETPLEGDDMLLYTSAMMYKTTAYM